MTNKSLNQHCKPVIIVVGRWWGDCTESDNLGLGKFWTKRGVEILGKIVKQAREQRGWTVRDIERLTDKVSEGYHKISRDTMSDLERAIRIPAHNTVVVLAQLKFIINPVTGQPFTEDELSDIAAERLDPETGKYKLGNQEPTIARLIKLEIKNRPWSPKRLALEKLATEAGLDLKRLEAIGTGEIPTDEELLKLAQVLTKENGTCWQELELQQIREKESLLDTSRSDLDTQH